MNRHKAQGIRHIGGQKAKGRRQRGIHNAYCLVPGACRLPAQAGAKRGFALIELLAVIGIFIVVSTVVLANNNKFGGSVLLQNLAYDIALSIRQAQVYGIAVRTAGAGNFSKGYGMYFDTSDNDKSKMYVLFADMDGDGIYDSGPGQDLSVASTDIGRGYYISQLCAPSALNGEGECDYPVDRLDIRFKRPEPDAAIRAGGGGSEIASARIIIRAPRGEEKSVVVDQNGQISVQ